MRSRSLPILAAAATLVLAVFAWSAPKVTGQQGGGPPGAPPVPRAAAPIDLTGYWVSLIVDEWRFRVTPQKGDILYLPINAEARRIAGEWDPDKDRADGNACRAYGAIGVMQRPGRLHITWENDSTLRIDTDAGTQTRLLRFGQTPPRSGQPAWQGWSAAEWQVPGRERGRRGAPSLGQADVLGPRARETGTLKVVTTHMKPGYIRKNGVPYSGQATLTETFNIVTGADERRYIVLWTMVEDPVYLNGPFIRSYTFKSVPDATGWDPTPCWPK
jgi:hypothetical protein